MEHRIGDITWTAERHAAQACVYMAHAGVADDHERLDRAEQLATIAIGHALTALAMALVPWCSPEIALGEDRVEDDGS